MMIGHRNYIDQEVAFLVVVPLICLAVSAWAGCKAYDLHVRATRPAEVVKHLRDDMKRNIWELGRCDTRSCS